MRVYNVWPLKKCWLRAPPSEGLSPSSFVACRSLRRPHGHREGALDEDVFLAGGLFFFFPALVVFLYYGVLGGIDMRIYLIHLSTDQRWGFLMGITTSSTPSSTGHAC